MKLQKALYGLLRATLLFYRKLRKELKKYGFEVNPYNPCKVNKDSEFGKQLTVIQHVDNLMASCKDDFKLTKFLCYFQDLWTTDHNSYWRQTRLSRDVHALCQGRSSEHNDGGIPEECDNVVSGGINRKAATLAADYLFNVREEGGAILLEEERVLTFHHMVAQLLFMSTRAR